jgi:hypothetical protein
VSYTVLREIDQLPRFDPLVTIGARTRILGLELAQCHRFRHSLYASSATAYTNAMASRTNTAARIHNTAVNPFRHNHTNPTDRAVIADTAMVSNVFSVTTTPPG